MENGYQEFFKKRAESVKKTRIKNFVARRPKAKGLRNQHIWLIIVAFMLSAGSIWYLVVGEEKTNQFLGKVEVSLFGEANAADTTEEKSAEDGKKDPAQNAGGVTTKAEPSVASIKSMSEEELSLYMKLDERKRQIDAKEQELAKLEEELQKHSAEVERRLASLEEVRTKISQKLEDKVKLDQQKVESLVSVYQNMKPVQAARIIESMNEDLAVEVLSKMKNKAAAEIVNLMNPDRAKKISEHFAGFREPAGTGAPQVKSN